MHTHTSSCSHGKCATSLCTNLWFHVTVTSGHKYVTSFLFFLFFLFSPSVPQSFTHSQIISREEGMLTQLLSTLPHVLSPSASHFLYFISVHYWWIPKVDRGERCQRNCSSLSQTQPPQTWTLLPARVPEEHTASVEEERSCNRKHHCYWLQGTQTRDGPADSIHTSLKEYSRILSS